MAPLPTGSALGPAGWKAWLVMARPRIVVALVSAVCCIAIAGCSVSRSGMDDVPHGALSGGQNAVEAEGSIAALPGVASVDVTRKTDNTPNVKGNVGRTVKVVLNDEFHVVDGPALVDFLPGDLVVDPGRLHAQCRAGYCFHSESS